MRYAEKKQMNEAYKVACLGATKQEWIFLGVESMLNFDFQIAANCFKKIEDIRLINLVLDLEQEKKNGVNDLILILGGGSLAGFVEKLGKKGVFFDSDFTQHIGYVDDEDLPILYSNAEWFVYTSQYEGFGLPPLEAMQCGCPVITSNNSSLPEVVGDAGIMIDWNSDEQHIEAFEKYYFDEKMRKENGRKGLERAKIFSWKKTADTIVQSMKVSL